MEKEEKRKTRAERITLYNIIISYLGRVSATGSHSEDMERLTNLEDYGFIINCLLEDIEDNIKYANSPQASMRMLGEKSKEIFENINKYTEV